MIKYFFTSLLFFFVCVHSQAQSYSFINFSVAEGLAQSQVSSIVQDEKGYLWVGTMGGLGRFNGKTFENFSTNNGLLNNRITSLEVIKEQLWVGHEGGVTLIENEKFSRWAFTESNKNISVISIIPFQDGQVIATNGSGLFFINKQKQIRNILLPTTDQNRVRGLIQINQDLYIATRGGLLKTNDLYEFKVADDSLNLNISGITLRNEKLFITTFDQGFFELDYNSKKIKNLNIDAEYAGIRKCILDSKGNIWNASREGLIILNSKNQLRVIDENKGLPLNAVSTIFEDKNGTIWIGSEGKGIFRFPGERFVTFDSRSGIPSDLMVSGIEINPNLLFFGSYDKGLISYADKKFVQTALGNTTIWAITKDQFQNIWVGSEMGLYRLNQHAKINAGIEPIVASKITCFYKNNKNEIWVGGADGMYKIINGNVEIVKNSATSQNTGTIRNIVAYNNQLICATDAGLFVFKNGKYESYLGINKKTFSLKVDNNNNLWIGTEEGFYWSDGKDAKRFVLIGQTASSFINFINFRADQLFVGTNNGLYVLSDLNKRKFASQTHFGLEEGIVNLESNLNSSFFDSKGILWFGTAQGLVAFDPNSKNNLSQNSNPYLNITSLKLNLQEFNYADYSNSFSSNGIPLNLKLPRSKNNLLIELEGISLQNAKGLSYQYWIEGLEETWSPNFQTPQVTLSNLPAGKYTLHVRANIQNKLFSNEYILEIQIAPIFYATWWFLTLLIMFISGVIILVVQFRIKRERIQNYQELLEFKARLSSLEQQSLNASMNRHFIFNSLNSIQYFINTQDRVSANKYLTNFAKLIRKNLDSSSEANSMVSLDEEIERLELYLSLEAMRFKDRFEFRIDTGNIDTENILVPAMLLQPFIENSIIHGILPNEEKKGLIELKIVDKADYLEVIIQDNGVGIDFSLQKKHNIKGDHRSQGMEITSKRIALLNKISNKNFTMEGPFQIEGENHSINGTRVILKIPVNNLENQN
ncbi:MAG: two-component regulator propeller domain-containing protein [Crocinitomicaceae bacterium]|nr:two-component regulator propeller domain-containing protein [Crocinitomicaceae bacterium]